MLTAFTEDPDSVPGASQQYSSRLSTIFSQPLGLLQSSGAHKLTQAYTYTYKHTFSKKKPT